MNALGWVKLIIGLLTVACGVMLYASLIYGQPHTSSKIVRKDQFLSVFVIMFGLSIVL